MCSACVNMFRSTCVCLCVGACSCICGPVCQCMPLYCAMYVYMHQNCYVGTCVYCVHTSVHMQLKASLSFGYGAEVPIPLSHPALVPSRAYTTVIRAPEHSRAALTVTPACRGMHVITGQLASAPVARSWPQEPKGVTHYWSLQRQGCLRNVRLLVEGVAYFNFQCWGWNLELWEL